MCQPPSCSSMRRPAYSWVPLSVSGAQNRVSAEWQSFRVTLASRASPEGEDCTSPSLSANARRVIQTIRVFASSAQTEEVRIEEKSLTYTTALLTVADRQQATPSLPEVKPPRSRRSRNTWG